MSLSPQDFPTRSEFETISKRDSSRAAQLLVLMREAARRNLSCFVAFRYFAANRRILHNWHIDLLSDVFTAVQRRQLLRTIINIPPRFLKSELIAQCFPAWMIGIDDSPSSSVFSAAATATLAARDARKTMDIIKSDWYQAIFPHVKLIKENEVEWETKGGAQRNAAGTEGTITGRGGDHVIWDDILLADEATSDIIREKRNNWLEETIRSRLNDIKTGTITGIMQRMHEDDPTGYLLRRAREDKYADQYTHICIPNEAPHRTVVTFNDKIYAVRETGGLLHPERLGPEETRALKSSMRVNYEGQYNQNPQRMIGGMLDPKKIQRLKGDAMALIKQYGLTPNIYMDFAATEKQTQKDDPDYSVIFIGAKDSLNRLIILKVWKEQCSHEVLARQLISLYKVFKPRFVKGEKGALLNLFYPVLRQQMQSRGTFFALQPLANRDRDKVARATAAQGVIEAGLLCAPEDGCDWWADLEQEFRAFPMGRHDDVADCCSDFCADYDDLVPGDSRRPIIEEEATRSEDPYSVRKAYSDSYKKQLEEIRDGITQVPASHLDW